MLYYTIMCSGFRENVSILSEYMQIFRAFLHNAIEVSSESWIQQTQLSSKETRSACKEAGTEKKMFSIFGLLVILIYLQRFTMFQ